MFQRYYDAALAQASYLLACARTRQAVVIDPRRDIDVYVAAPRQHQLNIGEGAPRSSFRGASPAPG